jgi:multidrug efflux pump
VNFSYVLDHKTPMLLVVLTTLVVTALLAVQLPKGFFPEQDTGLIQAVTEAPQSTSFAAMTTRQQALGQAVLRDPDVESLASYVGIDGTNPTLNSGRMLISLRHSDGRRPSASVVARRLQALATTLPGISMTLQPVQDLTLDTGVSPGQYRFILANPSSSELERWTRKLVVRLSQEPSLRDVASDLQTDGLAAYLTIDRTMAGRYGITPATIDNALYDAFGQRIVSTIFTQSSQYRVILEADPSMRTLEALGSIYLPSGTASSGQVPLSAVVRLTQRSAPTQIAHLGRFPAATISFNLTPGASLGDAIAAIRRTQANLDLPRSFQLAFQGSAAAFESSLGNEFYLILASVVTMYIVLGVLYESFIHPLTILSTLPSASVGALLALVLRGGNLDVIAVIGIVLLIGLVKKNAIMVVDFALAAEREDGLSPRAAIPNSILLERLSQISGVGLVSLRGSSLPAVRVEVNPNALSAMGIGLESVRAAITAANVNRPKGAIEGDGLHYQIYANDQGRRADDYRDIVIAHRNGAAVVLSDVAEIIDSIEDVHAYAIANGQPALVLLVYKQAGANIVDTTDRVKAALPALQAALPGDVHLTFAGDRSATIRASLADTERTLVLGVLLVVLVVFVFLRSWRAVLIPGTAVLISMIGTLAAMYLLGYSLNNPTLMALTISAGFVIDDAIVVLENVTRHMEAGMPRRDAALLGTREVAFTVVSMSGSLVAVFLPLLLLGGIAGRLFHEFAMTLSLAIGISLVLSLTLTPMMCGQFLQTENRPPDFLRAAGATVDAVQRAYAVSLGVALRHPLLVMLTLVAAIALNVLLFAAVRKGFFPEQDSGLILGRIRADQSITFDGLKWKMSQVEEVIRHDPAVESVTTFAGGQSTTTATVFIRLEPLRQRVSSRVFMTRVQSKLRQLAGTQYSMFSIQDLFAEGGETQGEFQFILQGDDTTRLYEWTARLVDALKRDTNVADITQEQQNGLKATFVADRQNLARYQLTPAAVDATLYDALGQRQVSTIYDPLNQYHVVMEVLPRYLQVPESLASLYVSTSRTMVPLSAVGRLELSMSPTQVNHQDLGVATIISFNLPPNHTLSQASAAIERAMMTIGVPASIRGRFTGSAATAHSGSPTGLLMIVGALLSVYVVLGILYESYVHPLTILSTLPSAGVGAVAALMLAGLELTLIALIGVILLIGIVKKNAIMMIDFALQAQRSRGLTAAEAIHQACLVRFRPIMMTTLAALLSAVPMILDSGAGSELRRPLGISIAGGLIVSQLLTLYTTPVVYLYLDRLRLRLGRRP